MRQYLGINYDGCHDSNVALLSSRIECALNEERLSGWKHDGRPPERGLEYLSRNYDVKDALIAWVGLPKNLSRAVWAKEGLGDVWRRVLPLQDKARRYLRNITRRPFHVAHQTAHAASAYFTSGCAGECLVVVIDAGNYFDPYCMSAFRGSNGRLSLLWQSADQTVAQAYLVVTAALGFKPMLEEGKVTGLASCGRVRSGTVAAIARCFADREYPHRATRWKYLGHPRVPPRLVATDEIALLRGILALVPLRDAARAVQVFTERRVLDLIRGLRGRTRHLCLAGGLFANVSLNRRIAELGWDSVWIHPAMGDEGLSLGAALYAKSVHEGRVEPVELERADLGPAWDSIDIGGLCRRHGLRYEPGGATESTVCDLLVAGKAVARCCGRVEYGPRALGNRSVLCNADSPAQGAKVNRALQRSPFMPFAPVVCDYQAALLFSHDSGTRRAMRFMTIAVAASALLRRIAPAAVHCDGSARPQVVTSSTNPDFYRLVDAYARRTGGRSVLINTSLNLHGKPIVLGPRDAVRTYVASGLDALIIEDGLITRAQG